MILNTGHVLTVSLQSSSEGTCHLSPVKPFFCLKKIIYVKKIKLTVLS